MRAWARRGFLIHAPPRRLTQRLSSQHPAVLPDHGAPGVPLAGVLDKSVALVHGATQHAAILGEDALHVRLLHHRRVQVANEDPRVDGLWIRLVGHVTGLDLQRHAGEMGGGSDDKRMDAGRETRRDDDLRILNRREQKLVLVT